VFSIHRNYTFIYVVKGSYPSGFKYIFYKDKDTEFEVLSSLLRCYVALLGKYLPTFRRTECLHLQDQAVYTKDFLTLKMKAERSLETS